MHFSLKKIKLPKVLVSSLSIVLIILTLFVTTFFFAAYLPGRKIYQLVKLAQAQVGEVKIAIANKDVNQVKESINKLSQQTLAIETAYRRLSYLNIVPVANNYYRDGTKAITIAKATIETSNILIKAIEPYQDFLGIKGGAEDGAKTTQDRINFLTQSIEGIIPSLDLVETQVDSINNAIKEIDANRYPQNFQNVEIRSQILKAQELVGEISLLIKNGKPILAKTPYLLGKDSPRTYLMLFQNDAELRPTGGFWTAYGFIRVTNGQITPLGSDDIYNLDAKFSSTIPAPRPIKSYHINVPYWNIRDMNISPDFPTSVKLFLEKYNQVYRNQEKIDAVIGIDTQVLVDIVKVIGQVGVPGWGNFSADPDPRCDGCPQIIYQLEWLAGRPRNYIETDRKGFLSPLLHSILSNAMGAEKSRMAPLFQNVFNDILQKHLLFYFTDADIQNSAQAANIAGQIAPNLPDTDYFHLSQANMSSAKTNLFLKEKIKHEINIVGGKVEHKISVTYTNPSKASNCNLEKGELCLNAPKYREWFRFFVSPDSQLIKMTGSEVEPLVYDELGKKVFEGFYGEKYPLYAQSTLKTSLQYTSSITPSSKYNLFLQKQPGTKAIDYELLVNGRKFESFSWVSDRTIRIPL